jgi:hypothetical protein
MPTLNLEKSSLEKRGEAALKGIAEIPLGAFTLAFFAKSTS